MSKVVALGAGTAVLAAGVLVAWFVRHSHRHGAEVGPAPISAGTRPSNANLVVAEKVFDGKFGAGWADWGWGPREPGDGGLLGVSFEGYSGIIFHHAEPLPAQFGAIAFRYKAPPQLSDFLTLSLKSSQIDDSKFPKIRILTAETAALAGGWNEAFVPMGIINPAGAAFDGIVLQANRPVPSGFVELDDVVLTKADSSSALSRALKLSVQCGAPPTPINPLIYGTADTLRTTGATARRIGGNPTTRMNWELGTWNTGADWYFENVKATGPSLYDGFDEDHAHERKTAIVVPIIGWVAKDATSSGFPVSKFGPQKAHDPQRPEAGDGHRPDGAAIPSGSPTQTSISAPPSLIKKWIDAVRARDAGKHGRSIDMYILDNEPSLWNVTHRDVHPDPVSYDELLARTVDYATAIREADPEAVIAGPAAWGWSELFFSAKDLGGMGLHLDRRAHGDMPLLPWYLTQLAVHEERTHTRLLDVVDVHFYPQATGIYGQGARTDPESAALRIRSTRALWDPTYKDESWIGEAVNLVPRVKEWIDMAYHGRGISVGEWSFGAEEHMSGGLAAAEALGRFGQLGITSAFYWFGPAEGTPVFNAFRAFRDFDGKGGTFLGLSVPTTSVDGASLFASLDEKRSHLVLVLLNFDPVTGADAEIDVSSCAKATSRRTFSYAGGSAGFADRGSRDEGGTLHQQVPPYSMTVLDVALH